MNREHHELVIVGGGISGLGFAHMAMGRGAPPLVIEAEERLGGCIHGHRFSTPEGEFWAELGAHTCFNSYGNLLQILEQLGELSKLQAKEKLHFRLLTAAGLKKIPSALSFFELLRSLPSLFRLKKEQLTAAEYFGAIVGRRNFERVLGPALNAVICQPAAEVPADSLFRKKPRRKEVMKNFTGPSGIQSFSDAIAEQEGISFRTGAAVTELAREGDGFLLRLADGTELEAERVALAVAPDVTARLLQSMLPEAAEAIAEIAMAKTETYAVLVRRERCDLEPVAGIIAADDDFYSAVSRDPVPDAHYRAFTFHFKPDRLDRQEKRARVCEVLGIRDEDVEAEAAKTNQLPALRMGQKERIARLDRALESSGVAVSGNWFLGVSIEDALTRSAEEVQRLFP
jgi:protoporphyrinogen oxidase